MVINSNLAAQASARMLGDSSRLLSHSLARLSSGNKLISPEDDVAGQAVSLRFDAQVNRNSAAVANLRNAVSFSQTQDGFLKKIGRALDRMSELAVLAQDVTKTDGDRTLYDKEFQTLSSYITDVTTKDYNGVSLFSASDLDVTDDGDGGKFTLAGVQGNYLPAATTQPYAASTTLGTIQSGMSGLTWAFVDGNAPGFNSTNTIQNFVDWFNQIGGSDAAASYDTQTGNLSITVQPGHKLQFQDDTYSNIPSFLGLNNLDNTSGSSPQTVSVTLAQTVNSGALDVTTASNAASALTTVKSGISQLATDRATVGANVARLNATIDQLGTLNDNLSSANSRIKDVDVADESARFARYNILVQAGTAMLAQANSTPSSVLRLLG